MINEENKYRVEKDSMGEINVSMEHFWGAQTQRSLQNFVIGSETMPREIIEALVTVKKAAAKTNTALGKMDPIMGEAIENACNAILEGEYPDEFPLKVWQTGSGTQTNMNVNEVIAHIVKANAPELSVHPNDHVNMSQSSNDTFPTAMHVAAAKAIEKELYPSLDEMIVSCHRLEEENKHRIKIGRTHLQDAVPLRFSDEICGWRGMLESAGEMLRDAVSHLYALPIGGTAVGTGLNCPEGFDARCCDFISAETGINFHPSDNKFHGLSAKDAYVFVHGALKALAADLMKIANDVRWLASGPRCGIGELIIPANEPGSSIMPGKVNPTQCEALTMVAVQVMGNDAAIGFAASQGNFQLNVFMPVLAYNMHQSIRLLSDAIHSFNANCFSGIKVNDEKREEHLQESLMLVTCLTPYVGYEKAAAAAHKAYRENTTLEEAVIGLVLMTREEYRERVKPEKMV